MNKPSVYLDLYARNDNAKIWLHSGDGQCASLNGDLKAATILAKAIDQRETEVRFYGFGYEETDRGTVRATIFA